MLVEAIVTVARRLSAARQITGERMAHDTEQLWAEVLDGARGKSTTSMTEPCAVPGPRLGEQERGLR